MDRKIVVDSKLLERAKKVSISNLSNDKYNWLLHLNFVRKNFSLCKSLADRIQEETGSNCAYAAYVKGKVLRLEGKVNESLREFRLCSVLSSGGTDGMEEVAKSLFLAARPEAALEVLAEAEKLSPRNWKIAHTKGICHMYTKDLKSARECFEEALALRPNELSYVMSAKVSMAEGNVKGAVDSYKRALEISPEDPETLSTLGLLYMQIGEFPKALECLGSALTFDSGNFKAILAVGSVLQLHGDDEVALGKYRQAAILSGVTESSCLWNNMAMCYFSRKKYVAAVTCLKRAHYLSPFHWKVLYNLALIHCSMQQFASAFHFATAAIGLQPKAHQLFVVLAVVLTNLDEKSNAKKAYLQAAKLDESNDPLIALNFSIFLCNTGEIETARKQLELLDANPNLKAFSEDNEFQVMHHRLSVYLKATP